MEYIKFLKRDMLLCCVQVETVTFQIPHISEHTVQKNLIKNSSTVLIFVILSFC